MQNTPNQLCEISFYSSDLLLTTHLKVLHYFFQFILIIYSIPYYSCTPSMMIDTSHTLSVLVLLSYKSNQVNSYLILRLSALERSLHSFLYFSSNLFLSSSSRFHFLFYFISFIAFFHIYLFFDLFVI